ncbi:hypothetical protein RB601_002857 [Gaeumannomyces tritici]
MAFGNLLTSPQVLLVAGLAAFAQAKPCKARVDRVFRNGTIHTLDKAGSTFSAMVVTDGRITHLGSDDEVAAHIGNNTTVIELGGRVVIPGLVDSHMHVQSGGEFLLKCNLNYQALSMEELLAHVQECIEADRDTKESPNQWIEVVNMDYPSLISRSGGQTKTDLDRLKTVRPVMVRSSDFHTVFANSHALALSNITAATPDPSNGKIERIGHTQEPSGILQDDAYKMLAGPNPPTEEDSMMALRAAMKLLREEGITTFQDAAAQLNMAPLYQKLKDEGNLTSRVYFDYRLDQPATIGAVDAYVAEVKAALTARHDPAPLGPAPTLKWQAVKLFLDGVITYPSLTAAVLEPYLVPVNMSDLSGEWVSDPGTLVDPYWTPEILNKALEGLFLAGIDVQMHADADLAVRIALDAAEAFRAKHPDFTDFRLGVAHDEISDPADWPRFAELGVDAIMSFQWSQPSSFYLPDNWRSLGKERFENRLQAYREIVDAGRPITYGSDWPIDPLDEFLALKIGATRSGDPLNPNSPAAQGFPFNGTLAGKTLTRDMAIRAITNRGASFLRADDSIGSLEVGKLADAVVLENDYFSVPEEELGRNRALLTMVGGDVLYVADGADFGPGVVAKFPNSDARSHAVARRSIGGFGGKGLTEDQKAHVAALRVRGVCNHVRDHEAMHTIYPYCW